MTKTESRSAPTMEDAYYHESDTEDGELTTFEAGAWINGEDHHYVEGGALAACSHPRPSRRGPYQETNCENPAIAKITFAGGSEMKVCREHYEKIRSDFVSQSEDSV